MNFKIWKYLCAGSLLMMGQWLVVSGQSSVVSGQSSVVSGQPSVVSGQPSVVSGQSFDSLRVTDDGAQGFRFIVDGKSEAGTEHPTSNIEHPISNDGSFLNIQHSTLSQSYCVKYNKRIHPFTHSPIHSLSITNNPYRYSGYYFDSESWMNYCKSRYYSPELMTFVTRDTWTVPNRYNYCGNDSIMFTDENGHMMRRGNEGKDIQMNTIRRGQDVRPESPQHTDESFGGDWMDVGHAEGGVVAPPAYAAAAPPPSGVHEGFAAPPRLGSPDSVIDRGESPMTVVDHGESPVPEDARVNEGMEHFERDIKKIERTLYNRMDSKVFLYANSNPEICFISFCYNDEFNIIDTQDGFFLDGLFPYTKRLLEEAFESFPEPSAAKNFTTRQLLEKVKSLHSERNPAHEKRCTIM